MVEEPEYVQHLRDELEEVNRALQSQTDAWRAHVAVLEAQVETLSRHRDALLESLARLHVKHSREVDRG